MKKILLIFSIILLVMPIVIAGFGGGNPGSAAAAGAGSVSTAGGGLLTQAEVKVILGRGEYTKFDLFGQKYTLKVVDIDASKVWISIMPLGILQKINVGATRRFDLNGNGLEDFLVKYSYSLREGEKAVLIYAIVKEIAVEETEMPTGKVVKETEEKEKVVIGEEEVKKSRLRYITPLIVLVIVIIYGIYWYKNNWNIYKSKKEKLK